MKTQCFDTVQEIKELLAVALIDMKGHVICGSNEVFQTNLKMVDS